MRALWLLLAAGCDAVFSAPFTPPVDATADAPGCSESTFVAPAALGGAFQIGALVDPTFASPRELWFVQAGTMSYAIRIETEGDFGAGMAASVDTADADIDPAFSGDGLALALLRQGRLHVATRMSADPGTPFPPASESPGIATTLGIELSFDGLTIYVADGDMKLRSAIRDHRSAPFGSLGAVLAEGVTFPSVSPDGLELFYAANGAIHRRTRTGTSGAFDPASDALLFDESADPDISADATTLLMSRQGTIMAATRACP